MISRKDLIIDDVITSTDHDEIVRRYYETGDAGELARDLDRLIESARVARSQRQDEDAGEAYKESLERALCDE